MAERERHTSERDDAISLDPVNTSVVNLFCAWSIGFLTAVEGTISIPSLWQYIQSLGGSHRDYGLSVAAFPIGRLAFMGIFGMWTDRRSYKEVFVVSLVISMAAGLIYSAAPTFGGVWAVWIGRFILGSMSAQSVATQAFVSRNTSLADRTKYMSINTLVSNVLTIAGPAMNLIIVSLPHFNLKVGQYEWVFNSYTWVGYFLLAGQIAILVFIVRCFREPPHKVVKPPAPLTRIGRALTLGGLFPWMRLWIDSWLCVTGSWLIFVMNFRNNFTNFSVNYAIPLITDRDYGYGQLENSYIFCVFTVESIISSLVITRLSKTICDRNLMAIWHVIQWSGLIAYTLASGFGQAKIPLWLFLACIVVYDFGSAGTMIQSLYSKLIGKGNAGLYFSVLQSNGAVGRVVSGPLVGDAYGSLGPTFLWGSIHVAYALSTVALLAIWKRLHPDYIKDMHARLEEPSAIMLAGDVTQAT